MIGNKIYIGNLYLNVNRKQLEMLFSKYGKVKHVDLIQGTGYGYVEMSNEADAQRAQQALDGTEFKERVIRVR
jgi:RNA recognition motif-containing protein